MECVWNYVEDGIWETGCGEMFQFFPETPTPRDNGFRFCPYCGRSITVSDWHLAEGILSPRADAPPPEEDVRRMREAWFGEVGSVMKTWYYVLIGFFTVREYIRQRVAGDVWRFSLREIWELFDESHRQHLLGVGKWGR